MTDRAAFSPCWQGTFQIKDICVASLVFTLVPTAHLWCRSAVEKPEVRALLLHSNLRMQIHRDIIIFWVFVHINLRISFWSRNDGIRLILFFMTCLCLKPGLTGCSVRFYSSPSVNNWVHLGKQGLAALAFCARGEYGLPPLIWKTGTVSRQYCIL